MFGFGAGAGGSGFTPDGTGMTNGVHTGNGEVTITFDPANGGCPAPGDADAAAPVNAAPRFTG